MTVREVVHAARDQRVNFKHSDKLKWCAKHLSAEIRNGTIDKNLIAGALDVAHERSVERTPVPYTREVLLADLRFVFSALNRRRLKWNPARILMALVIVCEARRSAVATGKVAGKFFVPERSATRLLGGRCTGLARSLEPLICKPGDPQNRLYLVQQLDPGNRFRARRMKACRTLQDHLRTHRTPRDGECMVNDDNLLEAIVEALGGDQDLDEVGGMRVDIHVVKGVHIALVLADRRVVIPIAAAQKEERIVTCEPVSWVDPWKHGTPSLIDELQLVREPVELMASTGLGDVDLERVKELLGQEADEDRRRVLERIVRISEPERRIRSCFRLSTNSFNKITGFGGGIGMAAQSIRKDLLRQVVVAPEGKTFLHLDLRSADALSVACLSGDGELLQLYDTDDAYVHVAKTLLNSDDRNRGKALFHLGIHGAGRGAMAMNTGILEAEVDDHLERLWQLFPDVAAYLTRCKEFGRENMRTRPSITGWYRHLAVFEPALCTNAPIAGTSGDLFRAFISRFHRLSTARGLLIPHVLSAYDGGSWELPEDEADAVGGLVSATLESIRSDFQLPVLPKAKWSVSRTFDA